MQGSQFESVQWAVHGNSLDIGSKGWREVKDYSKL